MVTEGGEWRGRESTLENEGKRDDISLVELVFD